MSTIVTRAGKGSPLTHTEVDNNFTNLNTDKYQSGDNVSVGTLSATGVATFSAGTVSAPAITTSGDTNTGIFFPAADTIAFTEGGVETMRIDSSGNVGIGTSAPGAPLSVVGNSSAIAYRVQSRSADAFGLIQFTDNTASTQYGTIGTPAANTLAFSTGATERMRITSAGNVGIGTSSPSRLFQVTDGSPIILIRANTNNANSDIFFGDSDVEVEGYVRYDHTNNSMRFATNGANERMRIDSSGNVGIGTSSPASQLEVRSSSDVQVKVVKTGTAQINIGADSVAYAYSDSAMAFRVGGSGNGTERMRIDSSGNVLVNGTTSGGKLTVTDTNNAVYALYLIHI